MSRVYHHHDKLEEYHCGLWRITTGEERRSYVAQSLLLMRDTPRFRRAMEDVVEQWPFASEHNLSAQNINRLAWLGHAGCCLAVSSPEDCTRAAWHWLSRAEQDAANAAAAEVIALWDDASHPTLFPMGPKC